MGFRLSAALCLALIVSVVSAPTASATASPARTDFAQARGSVPTAAGVAGDAPVWKGTVTTDETYLSGGFDIRQVATYTLDGASSTFESTYRQRRVTSIDPCGRLVDLFEAEGAGPHENLIFRVERQTATTFAARLAADDDHWQSGTRTWQSCDLVDGAYKTVTRSATEEIVVYPPGHLGCSTTVFEVPEGIQAIRSSVVEECSSFNLSQGSTWTYAVKLHPCDPTVDTDNGGVGDCREYDEGTNPLNVRDDNGRPQDVDADGVIDSADNCPAVPNPGQADLDADDQGDRCDLDIDGDGLSNEMETTTDPRDRDSDDDTVLDGADLCPATPGSQKYQGCAEKDRCEGELRSDTSEFKAVTELVGPNIHWYTTKVHYTWCTSDDGRRYLTKLDVDRHVEGGPIPLALGEVGWSSGTETPNRYDPTPIAGSYAARAQSAYTACFDLLHLLDRAGLKDQLKKRMKRPLRKGFTKVFKQLGLDELKPRAHDKVVRKFKRRVDYAFRKGVVTSYLEQNYRVPEKVGRVVEKLVGHQRSEIKSFLKGRVASTVRSGRYDGYAAEELADRLLDKVWDGLSTLTSFCGGTRASESALRTWDTEFEVSVVGTPKITRSDRYLHPAMSVK